MHVVRLVGGKLEVEDGVAVVHVESSRREIGHHQGSEFASTERGELFLSFHLIHASVKHAHWHATRRELGLHVL